MPLKPHEKHAITFMLKHLFYGTAGGFMFGGLLLAMDFGGLRTLAFNSEHPVLVIVLLFFGLFITFGSVAMAVGVMNLGEDKN